MPGLFLLNADSLSTAAGQDGSGHRLAELDAPHHCRTQPLVLLVGLVALLGLGQVVLCLPLLDLGTVDLAPANRLRLVRFTFKQHCLRFLTTIVAIITQPCCRDAKLIDL